MQLDCIIIETDDFLKGESQLKKTLKKILFCAVFVLMISALFAVTSFAAETDIFSSLSVKVTEDEDNAFVKTQLATDGERYFFLPSSTDYTDVTFCFDDAEAAITLSTDLGSVQVVSGQPVDLTALFGDTAADIYTVTLTVDEESSTLNFMKSENLRAVFFVSEDPVLHGLSWVDASKSNKPSPYMTLVGVDGSVDYAKQTSEIKARGNSTFTNYAKKAYQIKLDKKVDLLNKGSKEANKKWVLLANAAESTMIRNSVTFELAAMLNMEYSSVYEHVDMYYDGEYRGTYLFCEKTEVGSSRVAIDDLDDRIEEANAGNPAYDEAVIVTKTTASKGEKDAKAESNGSYKFVTGLNEPALPEGAKHHAYLLEIDYTYRYRDEMSGFVTTRGQAVVTGNPEYLTKDTGYFISSFWQEFEDAVYSDDGYNKSTGKYYYEYCDLDSLVKLYLINELGRNYDSFGSSCFFYLPEDSDIMYAGPVWDYDLCYGIGYRNRISSSPENFFAIEKYMVNGLVKIESFRDAVKATLNKNDGEFYNAVQQLVVDGGVIDQQSALIDASARMNYKRWDILSDSYHIYNKEGFLPIVVKEGEELTYENGLSFLKYFISERIDWLSNATSSWKGDNYVIKTDDGSKNYNSFTKLLEKFTNFFKRIIEWFNNLFK